MLTEEVHQDEVRVGTSHECLPLVGVELCTSAELINSLQRGIGVLDSEVVSTPQGTHTIGLVVLRAVIPVDEVVGELREVRVVRPVVIDIIRRHLTGVGEGGHGISVGQCQADLLRSIKLHTFVGELIEELVARSEDEGSHEGHEGHEESIHHNSISLRVRHAG